MRRLSTILFVVSVACGPTMTGGEGDDGTDDPNATPGSISGTVWAPGNAPGMVPPGHEIPVANAMIYVFPSRPAPIPDGAYCDQCTNLSGGVFSDEKGNFTLPNVEPATYWLVIQKGQFRLEKQIITAPGVDMPLAVEDTTLPSVHDPDNGKWTPRIAIAPGTHDALEDILGKMGLGSVNANGAYDPATAMGNIDVWTNGGDIDSAAVGGRTLADLVNDLDAMLRYHIIFIPCGGTANVAALQDQQVLRNIRDYVAAGGKLYVTDWSGEWADNIFPEQIEMWNGSTGSGTDTPATAYDRAADTWDPTQFGDADGSPSYTSSAAETVDPTLKTWLDGQQGPMVSQAEGFYNATSLEIAGNWTHIDKLHAVELGVDEDSGEMLVDEPKAWVIGDDGRDGGKRPLTVSFEPAGCGRVLFSTYHTTHSTHVGLMPQERILLYLIMEIGECTEGPVVD